MLRVGQGWDIHRLVAGRPLILGGISVPFEYGLAGHSDADVLTHALIDALLGAVADEDIGAHFPDTDPQWRDASSVEMLGTVVGRLRAAGWEILNVDTTLVAEAPRVGPFRERMRISVAGALGIDPSRVSIKAKTAEGLGPEGVREGISAQAVVLVRSALPDTSGK